MGYFICQHCGAHLHDSEVEDLYQWEDKESIGCLMYAQGVKKKITKK